MRVKLNLEISSFDFMKLLILKFFLKKLDFILKKNFIKNLL